MKSTTTKKTPDYTLRAQTAYRLRNKYINFILPLDTYNQILENKDHLKTNTFIKQAITEKLEREKAKG